MTPFILRQHGDQRKLAPLSNAVIKIHNAKNIKITYTARDNGFEIGSDISLSKLCITQEIIRRLAVSIMKVSFFFVNLNIHDCFS